jgi:hypothetical protein
MYLGFWAFTPLIPLCPEAKTKNQNFLLIEKILQQKE